MAEYKAKLNNLRISPRKVGLVIDLVRGMPVQTAITKLEFLNKKAAEPVRKLLKSAIANATNNFGAAESALSIKEIFVTQAETYKRGKPVSRGRYFQIMRQGSNITVVLESK